MTKWWHIYDSSVEDAIEHIEELLGRVLLPKEDKKTAKALAKNKRIMVKDGKLFIER